MKWHHSALTTSAREKNRNLQENQEKSNKFLIEILKFILRY